MIQDAKSINMAEKMSSPELAEYKKILDAKKMSRILKRTFDIVVSAVLLVLLFPVCVIIAAAIKCDSHGKVIYKQERITTNGKKFYIYKFRTMVENADKIGGLLTTSNEKRITKVGGFLRKYRIDEFPQLLNVLKGEMSFVGVRPEVLKYVSQYTDEMFATLLLPAGITSLACIYYKDEAKLLDSAEDADRIYIEQILPGKMYYNLKSIREFSFLGDIKIMIMTVLAVLGKEFKEDTNYSGVGYAEHS